MSTPYRFYDDLARWWPLISPPEEYAEEAAAFADVLGTASIPVREVLELGSGGGHCASHLRVRFSMTLVDLSEPMLAVSKALNPGCRHVMGDMRSLRLEERFDAVFVHDAIAYMESEVDLASVAETAFVHCRPGGIAVFVPDDIKDTFVVSTDCGGSDSADGSGARYLEWTWDPDPSDTWALAEYAFLLRDASGSVTSVHETHRVGLFAEADWLRILTEAGFTARAETWGLPGDPHTRVLFAGDRMP